MRIACWVHKATNTNSEYVILTDFPLQQWLKERATMLYIHCWSCYKVDIREYYKMSGITLIGKCGGFSWSSVKNSISYASPHSTSSLIGSHSAEHSWEKIIVYSLRQFSNECIRYYSSVYKPEGRGFDSRWCHWIFSLA
jgi:hypothetical protein